MDEIDKKLEELFSEDKKLYAEFREDIYKYLKTTLSEVMTNGDLDIIVRLISYIFGDLYMRAKLLPWQIDVDRVDAEYLPHLASIIGYPWNNALSADDQRESIKMYCLIRRYRGTNFGLTNLIRVFGQNVQSFYSSADLRGVEVVEYDERDPQTSEPNMFPGDIKIRIPELSTILRDSIIDTKLAGTRIIFAYYIFLGAFHMNMTEDTFRNIIRWVVWMTQGDDLKIEDFGDSGIDTIINTVWTDQLTHAITSATITASIQVLTYYKAPWQNGFVLNTPGLDNYRGYIEPKPDIKSDEVIYA